MIETKEYQKELHTLVDELLKDYNEGNDITIATLKILHNVNKGLIDHYQPMIDGMHGLTIDENRKVLLYDYMKSCVDTINKQQIILASIIETKGV